MHLPMHRARRCGARTRNRNACFAPAMRNGRCRLHGGKSTGPPKGNKNALKHGRYTAQAIARRRELRALLQSIKDLTDEAL
jgi:glucans biosynthesis protein